MQIILKIQTIVFCSLVAFQGQAYASTSTETIETQSFNIMTEGAFQKLQFTTNNPRNILEKFEPGGAIITNKKVYNNSIEFTAEKSANGFTRITTVRGDVKIKEEANLCPGKTARGYSIVMDFSNSDDLIKEHCKDIQLLLCVTEKSDDFLEAKLSGAITIIDYPFYDVVNRVTGSVVTDVIKDQVKPIEKALIAAVEQK